MQKLNAKNVGENFKLKALHLKVKSILKQQILPALTQRRDVHIVGISQLTELRI